MEAGKKLFQFPSFYTEFSDIRSCIQRKSFLANSLTLCHGKCRKRDRKNNTRSRIHIHKEYIAEEQAASVTIVARGLVGREREREKQKKIPIMFLILFCLSIYFNECYPLALVFALMASNIHSHFLFLRSLSTDCCHMCVRVAMKNEIFSLTLDLTFLS